MFEDRDRIEWERRAGGAVGLLEADDRDAPRTDDDDALVMPFSTGGAWGLAADGRRRAEDEDDFEEEEPESEEDEELEEDLDEEEFDDDDEFDEDEDDDVEEDDLGGDDDV
jgi:hypothetical protein